MAGLTLDSGALIAYERADARIRAILARAFAGGTVPTVPAIALAEVWRDDAKDARVARLLKACAVKSLDERSARDAGKLRRATPGANTIDACIAAVSAAAAMQSPHPTPTTFAGSWGRTKRSSGCDRRPAAIPTASDLVAWFGEAAVTSAHRRG